ncbi:MAG: transcriptional regulator [Thermoproteales archaeon]|nr:transcriptional regulator [Thermoproteales archaeon]
MSKDQLVGGLLAIGSVLGILIYGYLLFFGGSWLSMFVLKLTGFVAVAGVLGILAWIGYTLATTPPPKPIEEIEKELEEELKKLEEETKQETQKTEEKEEKKQEKEEKKEEEQRGETTRE